MFHRTTAALLVALCAAPACRSSAQWREDADREAYELVRTRREKLGLESGAFTIEPAVDALRARLVDGRETLERPLTLVEVLDIAAGNSREYQREKERLYGAALDLTLERWRFAIQKGGTLGALVEGRGDTAESASADAGFSLTRLLGTGATIVGSIGLDLTRSLIGSDGWHPTSDVALSFKQPLLAGFGERIVKEPLTQAERDLVYQVRAFERFRRTFAFDVASRYYRLLQLEDTVENQANNVANLATLTARNEALANAGRLSDIELGQARQNELRSRNDLLSAQQRLDDSRDSFKLFLGLPIQAALPLDPAALDHLRAASENAFELDEERATEFALAHRLDHQTALDRVDDAERRAFVAEDNLRAVLSVEADARFTSNDGKPLEFNGNDLNWSAGATLSLPFERLPQRNAWRNALIAREEARRAGEASADQITSDLRGDLRAARSRRESYVIQMNAAELAGRRIDSTRLKLDAGRADTRDLLEAQDALLSAQNAVTSALVEYTLSRLNLFLDLELFTVGERGIELLPLDGKPKGAEEAEEQP